MSRWLIGIFIVAWFLNSHVLLYYFPYTTAQEYYRFIAARNVAYETMFLILIVALYLETKGMLKAMACFAMILIFASVIDKAIFRITWYLWTDILLVVLALIASWTVWKKHG